jgi:hypothetical protein
MKLLTSFIFVLFTILTAQASSTFKYGGTFDLGSLRTQAGGVIDLEGQIDLKLEVEPIKSRVVGEPTFQPGEAVCLKENPDYRGELYDCLQYKTISWKVQARVAVATYSLTVTNVRSGKVVRLPPRDLTILAESEERYTGENPPQAMPHEFTATVQLPYGIVAFDTLPNFKFQKREPTLIWDARLNSEFKQLHFARNEKNALAPDDISAYVQETLTSAGALPLGLMLQLNKGLDKYMLASCPIGASSACALSRQ